MCETFVQNAEGRGSDSRNNNFEVSASVLSHTQDQHAILIKVKPQLAPFRKNAQELHISSPI